MNRLRLRVLLFCLCTGLSAAQSPAPAKHVPRYAGWQQLAYTQGANAPSSFHEPPVRPGRRALRQLAVAELQRPDLAHSAVPLPEAETWAHAHFQQGRFGQLRSPTGEILRFNPEVLLIKFDASPLVMALRVEPGRECEALQLLARRPDVVFAELDVFAQRQYAPNDMLLTNQWHHQTIGSFAAWEFSLGQPFVRIAIVDTPFQMDHPDLAAHADPGWDVVSGLPVTNSAGLDHSTLGAGLAAAVIDNALGVAGASNCRVLPINIERAISQMYEAVIWAADHGVRVVNLSWDNADSDTLNEAGAYLKTHARGVLAMAGVNGAGFLDYTNQPNIYCVSMTDAADNQRSRFGDHIDFAAPGWLMFSTTTNAGYTTGTGTSYATPLFCGVVALLFSINPNLGPEEVIGLLKTTAVDLGPPGWDQYFGWGRINFAAAARAAAASLPAITRIQPDGQAALITAAYQAGWNYSLWRSLRLAPASWELVPSGLTRTNGAEVLLTDPAPPAQSFYRILLQAP